MRTVFKTKERAVMSCCFVCSTLWARKISISCRYHPRHLVCSPTCTSDFGRPASISYTTDNWVRNYWSLTTLERSILFFFLS
jgi:hypothetical protein